MSANDTAADQPGPRTSDKPDKVRVTADLPLGTIEILRELAESQGVTLTEALKRAITTEGLIRQRVNSQNKLLLESPDGRIRELMFR